MLGFSPLASAPLGDDGVAGPVLNADIQLAASSALAASAEIIRDVSEVIAGQSAVSVTAIRSLASTISVVAVSEMSVACLRLADVSVTLPALFALSTGSICVKNVSAFATCVSDLTFNGQTTKNSGNIYGLCISDLSTTAYYIRQAAPQIAANSSLVAQMRLKWEDTAAQPEIWIASENTAGTWVPQAAHGETWSTIGSMAA